jgi:hypothetical protein
MKTRVLQIAALAIALTMAGGANASLLGRTVNFSTLFPNVGSVLATGGDQVVGGGIEYPEGFMPSYNSNLQVDITDTQVFFSYATGTTFQNPAFNGYQLTLLGGGTLSAQLDQALTTLAPVSFAIVNGNTLQVNMAGLFASGAFSTVFDLQATPGTTVIPVPGALLLSLSGLAMLGAAVRRTRR